MKYLTKFIILLAFVASLILSSCSSNEQYFELINKNIKAMEAEDVELLVSTLDVHNPQYNNAHMIFDRSFAEFDFDYNIEEMKVIEEKSSVVKVEAKMLTKRKHGEDVRTNKIRVIYTLTENNNDWKILKTEIKEDIK